MTESETQTDPEQKPESITIKEYNDLQLEATRQHLFIVNTLIQKVLTLEKELKDISS